MSDKKIKLQSSDDVEYEVELDVAKMSVTIKNMWEGTKKNEKRAKKKKHKHRAPRELFVLVLFRLVMSPQAIPFYLRGACLALCGVVHISLKFRRR